MKRLVPQYFFLLLVLLVTFAFFELIQGFVMAVFWAVILAILFYGCFEKIKSWMPKRPSTASGLTLVFILFLVVLPLTIISMVVVNQASMVVAKVNEGDKSIQEKVADLQEKIPMPQETLDNFGITTEQIKTKLTEFFSRATEATAGYALGFTQDLFNLLVNFFLMLYILFFFLRDGKELVQELLRVIPMKEKKATELLKRFESVSRATVKGSLVVAFVQGSIGGLIFWALGIHAAFLWGVLMILASLLPIGAAIIWAPWAIALFIQGDYVKGIILVTAGVLFIGLIDNFMRPRLVGQDAKMPDYLVLLSTLGGLSLFGLAGFVIGPVVAALFVTCWQMLGKEYGNTRSVRTVDLEEEIEGDG